jgi:hypothetical protein
MNICEIENKIECLSEQLKNLSKELVEKRKKMKRIFYPLNGDTYFYVNTLGAISRKYWRGNSVDLSKRNIGNIFQSEKQASRYLYRQILDEIIRKEAIKAWEASGRVLDYSNTSQIKFFIVYNPEEKKFVWCSTMSTLSLNTHYFPNIASVLETINRNISLLRKVHLNET